MTYRLCSAKQWTRAKIVLVAELRHRPSIRLAATKASAPVLFRTLAPRTPTKIFNGAGTHQPVFLQRDDTLTSPSQSRGGLNEEVQHPGNGEERVLNTQSHSKTSDGDG